MNRRTFLGTMVVSLLAAPLAGEAQPVGARTPRIGVLAPLDPPPAPNPDMDGFRQGQRELGYVEGQNIRVGLTIPPSLLLRADQVIE